MKPPSFKKETSKDRFISSRIGVDIQENYVKKEGLEEDYDTSLIGDAGDLTSEGLHSRNYTTLLQTQVLGLNNSIISPLQSSVNTNNYSLFKSKELYANVLSSSSINYCYSLSPACGFQESDIINQYQEQRQVPKTPFKVLDAPALQDDYYLDVVHWSKSNILAVGLGKSIYLWNAANSKVTKVHEYSGNDSVASISWSTTDLLLAVGSSKGNVQIWDTNQLKLVTESKIHCGRIGTMCWSPSSSLLSSGSRDKSIVHRDIRAGDSNAQLVARVTEHKQEVCGLRWSPDEQFVSSGGNDNKVLVWCKGKLINPYLRFSEHKAAVKALAWSPHQHGLLGTGGGTADRCIRFWDVTIGKLIYSLDTGSQVCNMIWGTNTNELITTHGYSQNQIVLWKYQPFKKMAILSGHMSRVLYLSLSPDGQTIVTGSGDETLRFWQVFPQNDYLKQNEQKWNVLPSDNVVR